VAAGARGSCLARSLWAREASSAISNRRFYFVVLAFNVFGQEHSMFSRRFALFLSVANFAFGALPVVAQIDDQLRINQIQVIGTHKSHHAGFDPGATACAGAGFD
jgi:hypothetical protein